MAHICQFEMELILHLVNQYAYHNPTYRYQSMICVALFVSFFIVHYFILYRLSKALYMGKRLKCVLWFCLFFLLLSSPSRNFYLEEGIMLGLHPCKRLGVLFLCLNCAERNRQRLSHWHFQHDSSASSVFSISIWEDQIRALSSFESRNAWSYTVPGSYLVTFVCCQTVHVEAVRSISNDVKVWWDSTAI